MYEFERELDLIEQRRSSGMRTNINDELNKMKQALGLYKNIEEVIQIGRLKTETVWVVITRLKEPLLTTSKNLSSMPVTQVFVEQRPILWGDGGTCPPNIGEGGIKYLLFWQLKDIVLIILVCCRCFFRDYHLIGTKSGK